MARIAISVEYCKGCGLCVDACSTKILELDSEFISAKGCHPVKCIDETKCTACGKCETMCPDVAIQVQR